MYRALVISAMASAALGGAIAATTEITSEQSRPSQMSETENDFVGPPDTDQTANYPGLGQPRNPLPSSNYYFATYPVYPPDPNYRLQGNRDTHVVRLDPIDQTTSGSSDFLSALVPLANSVLSYGTRLSNYVWNFLIVILVGGALTASICMFTPLCTIFLGLCFNKDEVREQVTELARTYITPESINVATLIVQKAIDKYVELQRQSIDAEDNPKNSKKDVRRRKR